MRRTTIARNARPSDLQGRFEAMAQPPVDIRCAHCSMASKGHIAPPTRFYQLPFGWRFMVALGDDPRRAVLVVVCSEDCARGWHEAHDVSGLSGPSEGSA